jgi:hypothetical protein
MSSIRSFGLRSDIFQAGFDLLKILWLNSVPRDQIDAEIQYLFEIISEVYEFDTDRRTEFDQYIHIAIVPLLITSVRAEHSQILDHKAINEFRSVR